MSRCITTRSRPPGQAEIDMRFDTLTRMADNVMIYKYMVKNVARQNGLTATFMPKPLFGDNGSGMHVHQSIWKGEQEPVLRRGRLRPALRHGQVLHRRPAQARAGAAGAGRADHQLLPPPGARLRGAGQPGLLAAQPLGRLPHPGLPQEPEGQARRVPRARPVVQPVPVLRRPADGRAGRRPEPHRSRRADGQGPLRPAAGGSQEDQAGAGLAGRGAGLRWRPTTSSC